MSSEEPIVIPDEETETTTSTTTETQDPVQKPKRVLTEVQRLAFLKGRQKRMENIAKRKQEKLEKEAAAAAAALSASSSESITMPESTATEGIDTSSLPPPAEAYAKLVADLVFKKLGEEEVQVEPPKKKRKYVRKAPAKPRTKKTTTEIVEEPLPASSEPESEVVTDVPPATSLNWL